MFCNRCGNEIPNDAAFCNKCGNAVNVNGPIYNRPVYNNQPVYQAPPQTQVALILGIIGIIVAWLFALAGHILSIVGIVKGIKELRETNRCAGLIVSIIGEICSIISSILGVLIMAGLMV